MFVINFKIPGRVVPEKYLTEKSLHTDIQTDSVKKKNKTYTFPLYFLCRGIIINSRNDKKYKVSRQFQYIRSHFVLDIISGY